MRTGLVCGCLLASVLASGCGRTPPGSDSAEAPPGGRARALPLKLHGFVATPAFARAGTTVELTFWSSELLRSPQEPAVNPEVRFGGLPMRCVTTGRSHRCAVVVTEALNSGPGAFTVVATAESGNTAGPLTPPVEVVLDFEPPVLSVRATTEPVVRGEPVAFVVEANEPLGALPTLDAPFSAEVRCSGQLPGSRFDCEGGPVPVTAPTGAASFVAAGEDRAGNPGTSAPGTVSIHTRPVVTIAWLGPSFVGEGGVISVRLSADQPLDSCRVTVAGRPGTCSAPAGPACSCSFEVEPGTADGTAEVRVVGENENGTGEALGTVVIDMSPPVVDGALVVIIPNDFGNEDAVRASPGGAVDGGASYPGRGVRTVRVWDSAVGGGELLRVTPRADGSFDELSLSGTADSTPRQLWASAVDAAGNEGGRAELSGGDVEAPILDRDGLILRHFAGGAEDSVIGAAGAVRDGPSGGRAWLQFHDAAAGGTALGTSFLCDELGGFAGTGLGRSGLPSVWVEARDKAGNTSRAQVGRVRQPYPVATWNTADPPEGAAVLVPVTSDVDPRTLVPGVGVGEPSAADSAAAAAVDEARAELSTSAEREEGAGWSYLTQVPRPRHDHAMTYDSARGVVVMFGGYVDDYAASDTWEFDGTRWMRRFPLVSPPPRIYHAIAYDPVRQRVVLFGGSGGDIPGLAVTLGDTWEYDGFEWTQMTPASSPTGRWGHTITYDPVRGRMVLYGGAACGNACDTETWEYDGSNWILATPLSSPGIRRWPAAAFDAARGRLVLFGGNGLSGPADTGTWEYDGSTWTLVQTPVAPGPRVRHAMAYDSIRQRIVLVGGRSGGVELAETWEYDGATWSESAAPSPAHPVGTKVAWDSGRDTLVLQGGLAGGARTAETWERGPGDWGLTIPDPVSPLLGDPGVVYDEAQQTILLVGGNPMATWSYAPDTFRRETPASSPSGPADPVLAYDAARARTVLFGGSSAPGPAATWEYDGSSWTEQTPAVSPSGRGSHVMAYDAGRARVVLFGGSDGGFLQDTWEYAGADWTLAQPATLPPARVGASMAYDGARQRLVLFGGTGAAGRLFDTWEYDGFDWTLVPTATSPTVWSGAGMVFDQVHSRIALTGNSSVRGPDETWEYDGTDWVQLDARPGPRFHTRTMIYDSTRGRSVVFGRPERFHGFEVWEYVSLAGRARIPAHFAHFPLDRARSLVALDASYVGSGQREFGQPVPGVELLAWDAVRGQWVSLGTHAATDADPAAARTISASLPGRVEDYVASGGVWLLAVHSPFAPARPPSALSTDYVELGLTYRIP